MSKKWRVILIIAAVFILIRISLPYAILYFVNNSIRDIPKYTGRVKDVDLHILRGNYEIQNVQMAWYRDNEWVQVVDIPSIEIRTVWSKIFQGKIVASVNVEHPVLTLYNRMIKPERPKAKGKPITEVFREITPADIETFTIRDAEIRFRNYYTKPNYVLYADSLYLTLRNLTNMQKLSSPTYASMDLIGKVMGSGKLSVNLLFNPIQTPPNFFVALKMLNLDVNALDTFSKAYGGFDFEKGTMDLTSEITMENSKINGYVKPIFRNLQVFSWKKDIKEDALKSFWEGIVGSTSEVFENQPRDQLSTRIPISGTISDPKADILTSVVNVLRGAFVKAFMPTLEGNVKPPNKK